jgi:hypothetical protein
MKLRHFRKRLKYFDFQSDSQDFFETVFWAMSSIIVTKKQRETCINQASGQSKKARFGEKQHRKTKQHLTYIKKQAMEG